MSFLKRADEHMNLIGEMMMKTGVDLSRSAGIDQGLFIRRAITGCLGCNKTGDCRAWLDDAEDGATPPDFCPNARSFENYIEQSR